MVKRISDPEVCPDHLRARTICVAGTWYCPDCIDEDFEARQAEKVQAEAED